MLRIWTTLSLFLLTGSTLAANYTCESPEVTRALHERANCIVVRCDFYDASAVSVESLPEEKITQVLDEARRKDQALDPRAHANAGFKALYDEIVKRTKDNIHLVRRMITGIEAFALDYNRNVGRYECAATITYNESIAKEIYKNILFSAWAQNPQVQQAAQLPQSNAILRYGFQDFLQQMGAPRLQYRVRYYVQPSVVTGQLFRLDTPDLQAIIFQ